MMENANFLICFVLLNKNKIKYYNIYTLNFDYQLTLDFVLIMSYNRSLEGGEQDAVVHGNTGQEWSCCSFFL